MADVSVQGVQPGRAISIEIRRHGAKWEPIRDRKEAERLALVLRRNLPITAFLRLRELLNQNALDFANSYMMPKSPVILPASGSRPEIVSGGSVPMADAAEDPSTDAAGSQSSREES